MFFAYDENKNRINALLADKNKEYTCPTCGCKVIPRQGEHNIFHFAHPKGFECDSWNYDMSEWHRSWQNRFPEEMQEVVLVDGTKRHRADVLIEERKLVIEFQHSTLSSEDFKERNEFYTSCGYEVIWLFDLNDKTIDETNTVHQYKWKWGSTTFSDFYPPKEKKVTVFFQFEDAPFDENYDEGIIEKLTWIPEYTERVSLFRTEEWFCLTPFEFTEYLKKGSNYKAYVSNGSNEVFDFLLPQDTAYGVEFDLIMKINNSRSMDSISEFVKNSINGQLLVNNFIYLIHCSHKVDITSSSFIDEKLVKYHIKTHMFNEIDKLSSECVKQIITALKENSKEDVSVENFHLFGRTIPEIMKNITTRGAGLINVQTGKDFYIPNSEYFKRDSVSHVNGRPKLSYGNKYSTQYWEVFRALNPEWIVKFS